LKYFYEQREHPTVTITGENLNYIPHLHREVEIMLVTAGELGIAINGIKYLLKPGDIAFVQPNSIHAYSTPDHCRYALTIFKPSLLPSLQNKIENTDYTMPVVRHNNIPKDVFMCSQALERLSISADDENVIRGYLYILTAYILSSLQEGKLTTTSNESDLITSILQFLNLHWSEEINLAYMAKQFAVTPEHLSRTFKSRIFMTFSEYLTTLRLNYSMDLLKSTNKTITEIAYLCGFGSERTFHRLFKSYTNQTPRHYRMNNSI
jgi:Transcriptional regulator containing an amidase domain and an AraC-type DNA-binding HTH domain